MNKKLAILIPSLESRVDAWHDLLEALTKQINDNGLTGKVEIISNIDDGTKSIGQKRNELIKSAMRGEFDYVAFFDDDDAPGENYIKILWRGIRCGADVVSLRGIITTDGNDPQTFEHSIRYSRYHTNPVGYKIRYERYPNHLNCMKLSVAALFPFPEIDHGEDTNFATQVFNSKLLKKEYFTNEIIYQYKYNSKK